MSTATHIFCPHCRGYVGVIELAAPNAVSPIEPPSVDLAGVLTKSLEEIEWPHQRTRISWVLRNNGLKTIGDLVQLSEAELLRNPNFGKYSLRAVKEKLAEFGLHLGAGLFQR
jgi:DNA-directed RNA polymerase alpha subunit